ncbi:hypothetical protein R3P38DRAFT_3095147 [Favolaschia claudopus]|uniref:Uncharacterized protein n=1 Tax=Favolaschia claudopus TaxID=2862362 RepID=A0AAV9ZQN3_9AGAR
MNLFFFGIGAEFVSTGITPGPDTTDHDVAKSPLDKQMLPYIHGKVSEEYQDLVEDGTSAAAVWKELKNQFQKPSLSRRTL